MLYSCDIGPHFTFAISLFHVMGLGISLYGVPEDGTLTFIVTFGSLCIYLELH